MRGYSRSKEDFRELLYSKYITMEEEKLGCLWIWEQSTDYLLCNWDSDLLPKLFKKDEIRYEYNQYKYIWSYCSCTIFAAVWMLSDLMNYQFTYDEIKEIDDLSYTKWRIKWQWWYVQSAVKLVADWWNEKKDKKVAFYRINKYDDEIIEHCIDNLYTIDWNYCPTKEYNEDKRDWMVDWTNFWYSTNWHSVDIIKKDGQRSVKDSWSRPERNIYGLKHKLSDITNYGQYFYIYTLVWENALEDIKRLNEMKTLILNMIEDNSKMWHLSNDWEYQAKLHEMNEENRAKLKTIEELLRKYV